MIRINLALRKGPAGAAAAGASAASGKGPFAGLEALLSGLSSKSGGATTQGAGRELAREVLMRIVLVVGVYFAGNEMLTSWKAEELGKVQGEIASLTSEVSRLDAEIAKRAQVEQEKKRIEEFELILKSKLDTIDRLMAGRESASRILRDLAGMLPKEVWLSAFQVDSKGLDVKGTSIGIDPVSSFLSALNSSPYFRDGQPRITEKVNRESGQTLQDFDLKADREDASEL
jgi:Tfp pilus assembly protein PilN